MGIGRGRGRVRVSDGGKDVDLPESVWVVMGIGYSRNERSSVSLLRDGVLTQGGERKARSKLNQMPSLTMMTFDLVKIPFNSNTVVVDDDN